MSLGVLQDPHKPGLRRPRPQWVGAAATAHMSVMALSIGVVSLVAAALQARRENDEKVGAPQSLTLHVNLIG